jgi:hypothetical protein
MHADQATSEKSPVGERTRIIDRMKAALKLAWHSRLQA